MPVADGSTNALRTDPNMRHRLLSACRPSATDAHLARRAAAGDDDAFETLYARYQPRLEAYCRSIVRHDEDARDAVQSAMTNALVALRRDADTTNVQGWLFRIAHNEAISLLRRRRPTTELHDILHDRRLGPAGDLLMREELRATLEGVRAPLGRLRHPLLLRELAGLDYGQVAEVVGGTPAAARKAVFEARTALSADRAGRDEACSAIRQSLSEGDGRRRRARIVRSHLQSCTACCAWERDQRTRRAHLAALLPAAAGSAGWLSALLGGAPTAAVGVSATLASNAKIAATLAVIAAGTAPVVERVEHAAPTPARKVAAIARPATATARAAREAVAMATASRRLAETGGARDAAARSGRGLEEAGGARDAAARSGRGSAAAGGDGAAGSTAATGGPVRMSAKRDATGTQPASPASGAPGLGDRAAAGSERTASDGPRGSVTSERSGTPVARLDAAPRTSGPDASTGWQPRTGQPTLTSRLAGDVAGSGTQPAHPAAGEPSGGAGARPGGAADAG
ncbi:MAG: hypothetical protein QOJ35_1687 [Solirubrobacteraceae bacterium]|nr:hypothetical protein [Solirubrobacteraceae bacterium]